VANRAVHLEAFKQKKVSGLILPAVESMDKHRQPGEPKRGYSIREDIAQDVDLLAWYRDRSSSSIVDEALMEHLERCKVELKSARKLWESKKA
jgi:hypothetical protein